jgi:predicted MFS family arabinose efflux permease
MTQVYVVALLSATAFVFSDAAVFGAVPALVGRERLARANGFLSALASAAEIVGPAVGGVLASTIGPTNALWVDAGSFLAAAAVQGSIRVPFREPRTDEQTPARLRDHVRAGLRFIRGHRTIATLIAVGFGNSFAFGAVIGLLVPYAVEQLGLADGDVRIGVLFSAGAVGSFLSGMLLGRMYRAERIRWLTPGTLGASSLLAGLMAVSTVWLASAGIYAAFSFSIATTIMVGITYRATASPDHLRSSVNVLGRMVAWGGQPFGAALGGLVAGAIDVRAAYVMAASAMGVSALAAAVLLRRAAV